MADDTLIIPAAEGATIEFKAKPVGLEREIVAFANADGGKLYIGINDQGYRVGLQLSNRLRSQIMDALRNCQPVPEYRLDSDSSVFLLSILPGTHKPYRAPDGFYLRRGTSTHKLSRDEILHFYMQENRVQFDSQLLERVSSLSEFEPFNSTLFARFRELAGFADHVTDEDLLANLGLIDRDRARGGLFPTHALVLLFCEQPEQLFPQCRTIAWLLDNKTTILDQRLMNGSLFQQLDKGLSYLRQHLKTLYLIDGIRRTERPEVPDVILREILLNALVHRDYFEHGAELNIKILPNGIEFSNPGRILHGLSPDEIVGRSFRRNPLLAETFQRAGYIERAGTGLLRVNRWLSDNGGGPLNITQEGVFFIATIPRPNADRTTLLSRLTHRQRLLLDQLDIPRSTQEVARGLGVSERQTRLELAALLKQGLIVREREGRRVRYRTALTNPGK